MKVLVSACIMGTPRNCAETINGKVVVDNGKNVDEDHRKDVALAFEKKKMNG